MIKLRNILKLALMLLTWVLWKVRQGITPAFKGNPERVGILYLSGMGDILCDTQFFMNLRKRYPQAKLTACFPAAFCDLQRSFFQFDDYIYHRSYVATLSELRARKLDLIIIPGWLMRNSVLAIMSNAKAIVGYVNDLSFSNRFLNIFIVESAGIQVPRLIQDIRICHLAERPNALARALRMDVVDAHTLQLPRRSPAENYAVIHAGARFDGKRWSAEGFTELTRWLLESGKVEKVILIGDREDRAVNQRIIKGFRTDKLIDTAGKGNLMHALEVISRAKLFIGNDSGPMHIAALSGVPTLALMGPYSPLISGPLGTNNHHVFHEFPCSGCNQRECIHGFRCIKSISSEEVKQAITEMM